MSHYKFKRIGQSVFLVTNILNQRNLQCKESSKFNFNTEINH
jgi:hypothetical protein